MLTAQTTLAQLEKLKIIIIKNSEVVTLLPFNFVEAALPPSVDHLVGLWCI